MGYAENGFLFIRYNIFLGVFRWEIWMRAVAFFLYSATRALCSFLRRRANVDCYHRDQQCYPATKWLMITLVRTATFGRFILRITTLCPLIVLGSYCCCRSRGTSQEPAPLYRLHLPERLPPTPQQDKRGSRFGYPRRHRRRGRCFHYRAGMPPMVFSQHRRWSLWSGRSPNPW